MLKQWIAFMVGAGILLTAANALAKSKKPSKRICCKSIGVVDKRPKLLKIDFDGDGKVTKEEAMKYLRSLKLTKK